jgi:lipopolysaccharide/colanic/teichoic acid biosynthesis glycosyltransferase
MIDSLYVRYMKGLFDRTVAAVGLVVLMPLFLLVAAAIKLDSPGPVFFRQKRVGWGFSPFDLYKFRTMVENASEIGPAVTQGGDPRVTRIGRFLRRYKLDELPQLVNVLSGEMSLVGPRPEVERYVERFRQDYAGILRIRPGITDYAALAYRNEEDVLAAFADMEEGYVRVVLPGKITLYKEYISRMGFREDLKIIFQTLGKVFVRP